MLATLEKKLDAILKQDSASMLGYIHKKVLQLNRLNAIWQKNWPDLAQHSRIANFRQGCLVIEVNDAAWTTRLRYLIPDLSKKLLQFVELDGLQHIEWYIQPRSQSNFVYKGVSPVLSTHSAQLLKNMAMTIKIESLQAALLQLSEKNT